TTSGGMDDPGSENDSPSGDGESDELTEESESSDTLVIGDTRNSQETIIRPDGSLDIITSGGNSTETITDTEEATDADQHGAATSSPPSQGGAGGVGSTGTFALASGAGLPGEKDTNHTRFDSTGSITDTSSGTSNFSTTHLQPVPNGILSS